MAKDVDRALALAAFIANTKKGNVLGFGVPTKFGF